MLTVEEIGILLTLLLTIAGWGVTSYYQRRILERQIRAEKDKAVRQDIVARRLQDLDRLKSWLEDGYRLWKKREALGGLSAKLRAAEKHKVDTEILDWVSKYGLFAEVAHAADPIERVKNRLPNPRSLRDMISVIYRNMPVINLAFDKDPQSPERLNQLFSVDYSEAMRRVSELIELTAKTIP